MDRSGKRWMGIVIVALTAGIVMAAGCSVEQSSRTKVRDLEYEIVAEAEVPEELLAEIEGKKAADFKMTYTDEKSLYIVRGYGEQETGGYSICVREMYLT